MDIITIRDIAFIAGCLCLKKTFNSIYDFQSGKFFHISASTTSFYDFSTHKHLSISKINKDSYNIYDYRTSNFINLKINGSNFEGYDFYSASFYNGTCNGSNNITIYSFKNAKFYNFSMS